MTLSGSVWISMDKTGIIMEKAIANEKSISRVENQYRKDISRIDRKLDWIIIKLGGK